MPRLFDILSLIIGCWESKDPKCAHPEYLRLMRHVLVWLSKFEFVQGEQCPTYSTLHDSIMTVENGFGQKSTESPPSGLINLPDPRYCRR